jgi:hypothetical protein
MTYNPDENRSVRVADEDYTSEAEALSLIIGALNGVEPSSRERIISTIATFYDIRFRGAQENEVPAPKTHGVTVAFSQDTAPTPKEFILGKQPQSDVERVACLAYYLTHYRDTRFFKTLDISQLNTEAAQVKFSNAAFAVNNATNYGYLVQATRGNKQLSAAGEQFVAALPDRDAAKAAMTGARPRRKSAKVKSGRER